MRNERDEEKKDRISLACKIVPTKLTHTKALAYFCFININNSKIYMYGRSKRGDGEIVTKINAQSNDETVF